MKKVVWMAWMRETKGAHVYNEVDNNGTLIELPHSVIGILYVRKAALNGQKLTPLQITIESE